jgi:hypothetical protein
VNEGQITNYFDDNLFGKVSKCYHGALANDKDYMWVAMFLLFEAAL